MHLSIVNGNIRHIFHINLRWRQESGHHRRFNDMQVNFVVQAGGSSELILDCRRGGVRFLRSDDKTEPVESGASFT